MRSLLGICCQPAFVIFITLSSSAGLQLACRHLLSLLTQDVFELVHCWACKRPGAGHGAKAVAVACITQLSLTVYSDLVMKR